MVIEMDHPATGGRKAKLIASPVRMSATPVSYRKSPPTLGQHTEEVLGEYLGMTSTEVTTLREGGVV
jgi:crotonobetainyl-CoA:carnitine CoA-transferase CaiB-like acyl-CoA transferase